MQQPSRASAATSRKEHSHDRALVERARTGDPMAFEAIMRQHNRLLFRCALGVVPDEGEAQDVVQEAYLRAFSRLADYRGDSALGTWLARIAFNAAVDLMRRKGRHIQWGGDDSPGDDAGPENPMTHPIIHSNGPESPDEAAERAEVREILQAAIESLPPIYRSVFILRAVEEASVDETARCLQVSDAVVRTRYLRARAMLRESIGRQVETRAPDALQFAGERCDAVVNHVLAELARAGVIRPH
jgi:RNA polymerase sigma factor (sigma-70 family)